MENILANQIEKKTHKARKYVVVCVLFIYIRAKLFIYLRASLCLSTNFSISFRSRKL